MTSIHNSLVFSHLADEANFLFKNDRAGMATEATRRVRLSPGEIPNMFIQRKRLVPLALVLFAACATAGSICVVVDKTCGRPREVDKVDLLDDIQMNEDDAKHVATCLGFGPRFLHSRDKHIRWAEHGCVLANHGGRRPGLAGSRPEIHLRRGESCAGARQIAGSGPARPPRTPHPPWLRRSLRACETGFRDGPRATIGSPTLRAGSSVGRASHF
jgi:hypothetical protein